MLESQGYVYHPGEPQQTQERVLTILASQGAWQDILLLLQGDWTFFEEDEEDLDE